MVKVMLVIALFIGVTIFVTKVIMKIREMTLEKEIKYKVKQWGNGKK
jgi:hypothetical protein